MRYEFNGISTEQYNELDRTENFIELYDGILVENKPFAVELDEREVELHLFIRDTDMSEFEDSTDHIIEVGVVPAFSSLTESRQEGILSQFNAEDRESMKSDAIGLLLDEIFYGYSITLRSETVADTEVEHKINCAIAVRSAISGLIGFELDRYQNRIGNTGWDYLSDFCEGKDLIKMALSRVS